MMARDQPQSTDSIAGAARPVGPGRAYYPGLDGLRAVAFLMVFFFHYDYVPWGHAGVEIFFVLSGFLITGILYDTRDDEHRFSRFYKRRSVRIFPLYYLSLAIIVVAGLASHTPLGWAWLAWVFYVGNWLMLKPAAFGQVTWGALNFAGHPQLALLLGHFWSLCVEEQFYLVWPAVLYLVRDRRKLMQIGAALIVLCPLARAVTMHLATNWNGVGWALYQLTPYRLDAFMYGALLALGKRGGFQIVKVRGFASFGVLAGVGAYLLQVLPQLPAFLGHAPFVYPAWRFTWGLLGLDLVSLCLLVLALDPGTAVYKILVWKPLAFLGRISYGLYVFHMIPMTCYVYLLYKLPLQHKVLFTTMLAAGVTLVVSWLSFRYFETPLARLKDYDFARLLDRRLDTAALVKLKAPRFTPLRAGGIRKLALRSDAETVEGR